MRTPREGREGQMGIRWRPLSSGQPTLLTLSAGRNPESEHPRCQMCAGVSLLEGILARLLISKNARVLLTQILLLGICPTGKCTWVLKMHVQGVWES